MEGTVTLVLKLSRSRSEVVVANELMRERRPVDDKEEADGDSPPPAAAMGAGDCERICCDSVDRSGKYDEDDDDERAVAGDLDRCCAASLSCSLRCDPAIPNKLLMPGRLGRRRADAAESWSGASPPSEAAASTSNATALDRLRVGIGRSSSVDRRGDCGESRCISARSSSDSVM